MRPVLILTALALVSGACSAAGSGPSASVAGPAPGSSTAPTAPTAATGEPAASPLTITTEAAGLTLVVAFDRLEVEAGGTVTVDLTIENTRATDVVFEEPCDTQAMTVDLRVPLDPVGRDWDGIEGAFKAYALENATGSPIESSVRTPLPTIARMAPCHAVQRGDLAGSPATIIQTGATYETVLTWTAELVSGLPAEPGPVPFAIKVLYDLEAVGGGMIKAETLEATGSITIAEGAPGAVTAGEALDAALADREFAGWLSEQPEDTWVNANLFLQPGAIGVDVLPEVPYWDVELYREPRNWAILLIDATSGAVLRKTFCDIPCDR